jgi:hypothetical protein
MKIGKKVYNYIQSNRLITPHQISSYQIREQQIRLTLMPIYRLKIAVKKHWTFWTHLIMYTLDVIALVFPTGGANMATGQSKLLSPALGVCKVQYQELLSANCKKSNNLVVTPCTFYNFYLFIFNIFRGLNPVLSKMQLCGGNWICC